jgi:methylmalonyl-CoA mutase N-terminal domain/subunit
MIAAIEKGFPQKEIAEASYRYQRAVEAGEKVIVGVNAFTVEEPAPRILYIDESVREAQTAKLRELRGRRSNEAVRQALDALCRAAEQEPSAADGGLSAANTMPFLLDCVRAYATVGEICNGLKKVMGTWEETSLA